MFFASCDNEQSITENPAAYNDTIIAIFEPVQESYNNLVDGIYQQENEDISELLATFRSNAEKAQGSLKDIPPFTPDSALYKEALNLADYYSKAANDDYQKIVEILEKNSKSVEEEMFLDNFMMTTLEDEKVRFDEFTVAQEKFAERHNVTLVYPE